MSNADSDYDRVAHAKLLKSIQAIGKRDIKRGNLVNKKVKKVSTNELINAIHSTRNLDDVKKKVPKKKKVGKKEETMTLSAPLHRLATERIQSNVAYTEAKRELAVWTPVVRENRLADQLIFPIEKEEFIDQIGIQSLENLKPRTPLEVQMASIIGTSKSNLHNEQSYTEAEVELLKAMSLKEAKANCARLRKMRALMSNREAKLRRQAKIKSKSYHRRLKRQKRRQLIKEFDELLAKDPEAAKEKLAEIEHQRILERATLKHRNGSKRIQMLARHASKDTNIKRALEEQIRFGRELVQKHGVESGCDSDSDNGQPDGDSAIKPQQLLERAAEIVVREETFETSESCRVLKMSLSKLRAEQKLLSEKSAANAQQTLQEPQSASSIVNVRQEVQTGSTKLWEEDTTWDTAQGCVTTSKGQPQENTNSARVEGHTGEDSAQPLGKRKSHTFEKKKKKKKMKSNETSADVEELFTNFEQRLIESTCKEAELIRSAVMSDGRPPDDSITPDKDQMEDCASGQADDVEAAGSMCAVRAVIKKAEEDEEKVPEEVDISLDPRHFLKAETGAITQISADIMDRVNEFDAEAEQEVLVAAAFEDDDVIGDFEAEKAAFEEREKPKDLDLNLQGWGSWAGPGIAPKKKNKFIIKAKGNKRKDRGRHGLIISEAVDSSIDKIQPRSVPFPYTTVEDYEAVVRQPLGKEWNPQRIHQKLIKPAVLTRAGRIIKPLDKEETLKGHIKDASDEES